MKLHMKTLGALLAASFAVLTSAHAQNYIFQGQAAPATGSPNDAFNAANYASDTAPTAGDTTGTNEDLLVDSGSSAFDYAYNGTTVFATSAGTFNGLVWLGYPGSGVGGTAGVATTNFTAGTAEFNGVFINSEYYSDPTRTTLVNAPTTEGLWVGNNVGFTASITLNGGNLSVMNGTVIGRDGSAGSLSVSNGSFTTGALNATVGMFVGNIGGDGTGTGLVTIGNGGLVYEMGAALDPLEFVLSTADVANATSDFIDFTSGSTGDLALNLTTATLGASYITDLITNGYVEVNGKLDNSTSDFTINTSNLSDSTLSLAAAPEPSTWAMLFGGFALLLGVQRLSRKGSV